MGYTHYWYRPKEIERSFFVRILSDFKKLLPELSKRGVKLADGTGEGNPVLSEDEVLFNGPRNCGHPKNNFGIAWPSKNAGGVESSPNPASGTWFGGLLVDTRVCAGDCSHEGFFFPRVLALEKWEKPEKDGRIFQFCKTAFKPYDMAIISFLIIAKERLKEKIRVKSDGEDAHWFDGKILCELELGYGLGFALDTSKNQKEEAVP